MKKNRRVLPNMLVATAAVAVRADRYIDDIKINNLLTNNSGEEWRGSGKRKKRMAK